MFHILYYSIIIISNISNVKIGRISSVSFEQRNLPDLEMFVNVFFFQRAAKKAQQTHKKYGCREMVVEGNAVSTRACWSPSSFQARQNMVTKELDNLLYPQVKYNIAIENRPSKMEISSSNYQFSRAMLVAGRQIQWYTMIPSLKDPFHNSKPHPDTIFLPQQFKVKQSRSGI